MARISAAANTEQPFSGGSVRLREAIGAGHKVAVRDIPAGSAILKYGQNIGIASTDIAAGSWVHVHNVTAAKLSGDYEYCTDIREFPKPTEQRTFMGYRRANGTFGTRNYVALISTVNCSATTARYVAQELSKTDLSRFPNVDGVI
ncbi:MAG: UxaA family hydrolase, partial [Planctomyces sp.]